MSTTYDILTWIRGVIRKMLGVRDVKTALKMDIAISPAMREAIEKWMLMLRDQAPWLDGNTQSLGLPAAIAGELARLVTVELESGITGSPRADYLQTEYRHVLDKLRVQTEYAVAVGGMAFKPYVDGTHIAVDCVPAWRFFPVSFNSRGDITGAAFVEQAQKGKWFYTRVELHRMTNERYAITNQAFASMNSATLGAPVSLSEIDEWAGLVPELSITYQDGSAPERALFAYFKVPLANTVDTDTPLGASIYSRATELIEQADKQYSRILWEYEASELAIDISEDALMLSAGKSIRLPERRKRLFRGLGIDLGGSGDLYKVFSPEIRDTALFHGLDRLLKRIEFNCNLSYGTLSDPTSVEKTAEEIKSSRQRSYTAVCDAQKALQGALEHLVWAMDLYASLYKLAPQGAYELSFTWGDGVLENTDVEFARRMSLVTGGYLRPEKFIEWYFGVKDEKELAQYMPSPGPPALFPEE